MKIRFWGTRGSIAAPGRETVFYGGNTSCLEISLSTAQKIIVDAGTGIRPLGNALCAQSDSLDIYLLLTHIHWDHVQGFPFFDPAFHDGTRIWVDGHPRCMKGLRAIFDHHMGDGFFPLRFDQLRARIQHANALSHGPVRVGTVNIDTIPLHHPQGGFGFRFREGKKTLVFITDNELTPRAPHGKRPEDYACFARDADILIHDAQYNATEILSRRGWGHSDFESTVNLALSARAKKLILFHHDPSHTDRELRRQVKACQERANKAGDGLQVLGAREGDEFIL